jgi:hypothetical protein
MVSGVCDVAKKGMHPSDVHGDLEVLQIVDIRNDDLRGVFKWHVESRGTVARRLFVANHMGGTLNG